MTANAGKAGNPSALEVQTKSDKYDYPGCTIVGRQRPGSFLLQSVPEKDIGCMR